MATGHNIPEIYLWDITNQKVSAVLEDTKMPSVSNIDFSENGYHMISSCRESNLINLWDLRKQEVIKSIEIPLGSVQKAEFDFVGKYIAISAVKGDSYVYSVKSGELIPMEIDIDMKGNEFNYMKFDRDMEYVLNVCGNGDMNVNFIYSN